MVEDHTSGMLPGRPRGDTVQSVERCFALLEAFSFGPTGGMTMAQLAARTDLPRPVVRRLLLTLEGLGYVERLGASWWLAPTILRLGSWFAKSNPLVRYGLPRAEAAARLLDEAVVICQLGRRDCQIVAVAPVEHLTTVRAEPGQSLPVHATAAGQILLAWRDEMPPFDLPRLTRNTITTRAGLDERLAQVRRDGFVVVDQEVEEGLVAAAAPIRFRGEVAGALNVAAPAGRLTAAQMRDEVVPVLLKEAAAIGSAMEAG